MKSKELEKIDWEKAIKEIIVVNPRTYKVSSKIDINGNIKLIINNTNFSGNTNETERPTED